MECFDGEDNDQDGLIDCDDPKCVDTCREGEEIYECFDGLDNDQNGRIDCQDSQCDEYCD